MIDVQPPDLVVSLAVQTAGRGPCAKSKRGVVIYGPEPESGTPTIYGNAFNSQPWPYECDGTDACKAACARLCVHAEQRAILRMLMPSKDDLAMFIVDGKVSYPKPQSLSLVHVKIDIVHGKPMLAPSPKGPSCEQCSKLIVENRWIGHVWLYNGGGWDRYSPERFHRSTLIACGLPITL